MSDMVYTFKISDNSPQSQSIINMLLSLSKDYDFLTVEEKEENELTHEQEAELDRRYQSFLERSYFLLILLLHLECHKVYQ